MEKNIDRSTRILGVRLFSSGRQKLLVEVVRRLEYQSGGRALIVFTPNAEQLVLAEENDSFRSTLNSSAVNVPDSVGLVWADWWLSLTRGRVWNVRERIAGVDLAENLCAAAAQKGLKVFLVGGRMDMAPRAVAALSRRFAGLQADGFYGSIDVAQENSFEWRETIRRIQAFGPALVLVGFGAPKQEEWIARHVSELERAGVRVVMAVGGGIDMWAGKTPRAPLGVRNFGLEWLWRLVLEPWRIKRQLKLLKFVWLVLTKKRINE